MNKILLTTCLITTIFITSCEKEKLIDIPGRLDSYSIYSMHYPDNYFRESIDYHLLYKNARVKLFYDRKNRVIRKTGDFYNSNGIGRTYKFSNEIYTEIKYSNKKATIETKSNLNYHSVDPRKKIIYFDNNNRLIKKITDNDTVFFFYDELGRLEKTTSTYADQNFRYDPNNNLQQITKLYKYKLDYSLIYKEIYTFSDYDNSPNLTKNLIIFEECFFRSLSNNNYQTIKHEMFDNNNNSVYYSKNTFTFPYDKANNPIF